MNKQKKMQTMMPLEKIAMLRNHIKLAEEDRDAYVDAVNRNIAQYERNIKELYKDAVTLKEEKNP
jgi:hypothetical protein